MSTNTTTRRRFIVVLTPTPDASPSPERALARFLKMALRSFGMRALSVSEETANPATLGRSEATDASGQAEASDAAEGSQTLNRAIEPKSFEPEKRLEVS